MSSLLPLATACAQLSCGRKQLLSLVRQGKLRGLKVGQEWRFDPDDLDAFVEQQKREAAPRPKASPTPIARKASPARTELKWKGADLFL